MSPVKPVSDSSRAAKRAPAYRPASGEESDFSDFDLRATLATTVVREANFSEFLAAIKAYGGRGPGN